MSVRASRNPRRAVLGPEYVKKLLNQLGEQMAANPSESDAVAMNRLRRDQCTPDRIFMPATHTLEKRNVVMPPMTLAGATTKSAPILEKMPARRRMTPQT